MNYGFTRNKKVIRNMVDRKTPFEVLDLSGRLRMLMASQKLTVAEMSQRAGVSKSAMEKYLAGPSSPRATAIASLCASLKVSADWLLFGVDDDLWRVQNSSLAVIFALLEDLKRSGPLSDTFQALELGSHEWRNFTRELAFERAAELRNMVAQSRSDDAASDLKRVSNAVFTDLGTGKIVSPDEEP